MAYFKMGLLPIGQSLFTFLLGIIKALEVLHCPDILATCKVSCGGESYFSPATCSRMPLNGHFCSLVCCPLTIPILT